MVEGKDVPGFTNLHFCWQTHTMGVVSFTTKFYLLQCSICLFVLLECL